MACVAHLDLMDLCAAPGAHLCLAVPHLTPTLALIREWAQGLVDLVDLVGLVDLVDLEGLEGPEGLVWAP